MAKKLRVFELARQLSMENKELLEKIGNMGIEAKSHLSSLDDDIVEKIRAGIRGGDVDGSDAKQSSIEEKRIGKKIIRRRKAKPKEKPQKVKKIEKAHLQLEQQLKREPTDEEVARAIKLPLEDYYKHKSFSKLGFLSYEDHWDGEGAEDLLELIFNKQLKLKLTRAISNLPEKERVVIDFYYFKEKTLKEAAEFLKVSEGRASQLHKQAMARLKSIGEQLEQRKPEG